MKSLCDSGSPHEALSMSNMAIASHKSSSLFWNARGYVFAILEQFKDAVECFEKAISITGYVAEFHSNKGAALFSLGKLAAAEAALDRAYELNPSDDAVLMNKAELLIERSKEVKARTEVIFTKNPGLKFATMNQKNPDVVKRLMVNSSWVKCNRLIGQRYQQLSTAIMLLEESIQLRKAVDESDEDAELLGLYGEALCDNYQGLEALDPFTRSLELAPKKFRHWVKFADALVVENRCEEAITVCLQGLEQENPSERESATLEKLKGDAHLELKQYSEALNSYENAIKINPSSSEYWLHKGLVLADLEQNEEAIQTFNKAIALNEQNGDAWYQKARIEILLAKFADAKVSLDTCLNFLPGYEHALADMGVTLSALAQFEEAIGYFDQVIELGERLEGFAWANKGLALSHLDKPEEAVIAFQKARDLGHCEHDPAAVDQLTQLGRFEEVAELCRSALEKSPHELSLSNHLIHALFSLQKHEEALAVCETVLLIDADYNYALECKASILEWINRFNESIEIYDRLSSLNPEVESYVLSGCQVSSALGNFEETLTRCESGLQRHPNCTDLLREKVRALICLDRCSEALSITKQLFELDKNNPAVVALMIVVLEKTDDKKKSESIKKRFLGADKKAEQLDKFARAFFDARQYDHALSAWQMAIKEDNLNANYWYDIACCRALMENIEAIECLEKALRLDDGLKQAARRDRDFQFLRDKGILDALTK